ncbi:hypothetical protein FHS44_000892 [Streptosporangium saharense]|uniref:Uncharacterized protein n=1 Tax=Streptosporangium saharense TaxID=1706840 RepID=A0A7W7QHR7_9ACTN|nr:hypothetical protein [Streptosporangium saharense]
MIGVPLAASTGASVRPPLLGRETAEQPVATPPAGGA